MGFWTGLLIGALSGALAAWLFLPEPAFVRQWWERMGLAKPTRPKV